MADVRYTVRPGQKPTPEQLREIEEAVNRPIVFDEDCPEISEEKNPVLFAAMMKAVSDRNRRLKNGSITV